MVPCIEMIQVFGERNCYKPYQVLRHHNLNEASRIFINCSKRGPW